tara:strand:+ start:1680 stop:2198 length:519 start_codon:yes stop_codon:yes gene_type:complete
MVVKSATKKKLMDMGIPEEVAHLLSDDRKWADASGVQQWDTIKDLMNREYEQFVDIIRPVMNHYPFKNAPVENLMLWHGIINEEFVNQHHIKPEEAVFYTGVGHVMYLGGGSPVPAIKNRLKQYVEGSAIPDPTFESKRWSFQQAWKPTYIEFPHSINYKDMDWWFITNNLI